ncbi:MAG TPA: ATP synthase subunit I [Acidimicrobiia bacterium]|nr:ATP synthase subunit I [Acidimicrobiia bacterium]
MSRTASQGLLMVGGFMGLLILVAVAFVEPDADGARGAAIGAGLGLVNLAVGYVITRRSLQHGMKSAMATLAGGFLARLFVVVSLILLFRRTGSVDPAAFALTFLVFFFAYLGVEMILVERSLTRSHEATA